MAAISAAAQARDSVVAYQNAEVDNLARRQYTRAEVDVILDRLAAHGTLRLKRYSSGGHSAVTIDDQRSLESAVDGLLIMHWDRDNIMQAIAEQASSRLKGRIPIDANSWKTGLAASLKHHYRYRSRFTDLISGNATARPHIRYNPIGLTELTEPWGHAQNDALSYVAFLLFWALNQKQVDWADRELQPFAETYAVLLPRYFEKIRVWEDVDLGAWEDKRAEHASSIGCALGALVEQRRFLLSHGPLMSSVDGRAYSVSAADLEGMIERCRGKLHDILPNEYIRADATDTRADTSGVREVDAGLINALFLGALSGEPLFSDEMTLTIIGNIERLLMGPIGIARYPHDIWDGRVDRKDLKVDEEAQWSHVSPMISCILGEMYRRTGDEKLYVRQVEHFNRSLAHVNGRWRIPEAYIVDPATRQWVADANEPLAWAQAATLLAFDSMYRSLDKKIVTGAAR